MSDKYPKAGRPVTRQQAREKAMQILHEAEAERERCAISEAKASECPDCADLGRQLAEAKAELKQWEEWAYLNFQGEDRPSFEATEAAQENPHA